MSTATISTPDPSSGSLLPSVELEQTLTMLTSNRSVLGYVLMSRGQPATIIRHSGVVFDGEQGKKYAGVISRAVEGMQAGLDEMNDEPGASDSNELRFMRIRTRRHEIMISPDDKYVLAVLQDPTSQS